MLSAKTLPLTAAGNTQRRTTAAPSKRKATTSLSHPSTNPLPKKPRQTTIEDVEDNEGHAFNTLDSVDMLADALPRPLGKSNSLASVSSGVSEPRPLGKSDSQASLSSVVRDCVWSCVLLYLTSCTHILDGRKEKLRLPFL